MRSFHRASSHLLRSLSRNHFALANSSFKFNTSRGFSSLDQVVPHLQTQKPSENLKLQDSGTVVTHLKNRAVVSVRGPDATDLLQNLTTVDVRNLLEDHPHRAALYTSFLNAKGRVLFDGFIVKPRLAGQGQQVEKVNEHDDIEYWVDVEKTQDLPELLKHLKKYAMRKRVEFQDLSHVLQTHQLQNSIGVVLDLDSEGNDRETIPGAFFGLL
jgi:folate-binding Fe-S cluster repair protein YgfZ